MFDTKYQCDCGWIGTEYDMDKTCVFAETRYEPAEWEAFCPDCGKNADDIPEAEWCRGCEDVIVEKENELCDECYMESVADQLERWKEEHGS